MIFLLSNRLNFRKVKTKWIFVNEKENRSFCFVVEVSVDVEPEREEEIPLSNEENNQPSFIETELFIREEGDPIEPIQQYSTNIERTPSPTPIEDEQHDEEFEKNFLRAVDRALGVVNKDLPESIEPVSSEVPQMDLTQITELALASVENSSLFTVNVHWINFDQSTRDLRFRMRMSKRRLQNHRMNSQKPQKKKKKKKKKRLIHMFKLFLTISFNKLIQQR